MSKKRELLGDKANAQGPLDDAPVRGRQARKFSRRLAIQLLAEGVSQTRAAEILGITQPMVSIWMRRDDVKAAIDAHRAGAREAGRERLTGMVRGALDTLDEIMNDRGCDPKARIAAAKEILARVYDVELVQAAAAGALSDEDWALARKFIAERDAETAQVPA